MSYFRINKTFSKIGNSTNQLHLIRMIYLNLFIFLLFANVYILNLSLCTSTDNENDLFRNPIDLELRLGQPGIIVGVNSAQSPDHELNQMQSKSKKGQKRKREGKEKHDEDLQAEKERKREYTRLSARKRRQKIREKVSFDEKRSFIQS
jgi:hypothetical protein